MALCIPASLTHAQTWSVDFNQNPPYVPDSSVIGVGGWNQHSLDSGDVMDATIVEHPLDSSRNVLKLISTNPVSGSANKKTIVNQAFSQIGNGGKVQVLAEVGITWSSTTASWPASVLFNTTGGTPFEFGFAPSLGIYYAITGSEAVDRISILPITDLKSGYLYNFEIIMDFDNKTTDFYVRGFDANDNVVDLSFEGLAFRPGAAAATGINNVFLSNRRGDRMTMYVGEMSIQTIPEPETVAALLGLVGLLAVLRFRKQKTS